VGGGGIVSSGSVAGGVVGAGLTAVDGGLAGGAATGVVVTAGAVVGEGLVAPSSLPTTTTVALGDGD